MIVLLLAAAMALVPSMPINPLAGEDMAAAANPVAAGVGQGSLNLCLAVSGAPLILAIETPDAFTLYFYIDNHLVQTARGSPGFQTFNFDGMGSHSLCTRIVSDVSTDFIAGEFIGHVA